MAENRFAGVYERAKARFIDEIRKLKRKAKEIAFSDVGVSSQAAAEGLQRLAVIKLIGKRPVGTGTRMRQGKFSGKPKPC